MKIFKIGFRKYIISTDYPLTDKENLGKQFPKISFSIINLYEK